MNKRFMKAPEPRFWTCFVLLLIFSAVTLMFDFRVAAAEFAVCIAAGGACIVSKARNEREMTEFAGGLVNDISLANKDAMLNFSMSAAVIESDTNEIVWGNPAFADMVRAKDGIFGKRFYDLVPDFDMSWVMEGKTECPHEVSLNDKVYRVYGSMARNEVFGDDGSLITLYWLDVSDYSKSIAEFESSRQTVAVIMIDNYEEIMNGLDDSERSEIIAAADKKLAGWVNRSNGIFIKYERDKYLFVFEERYLADYVGEKFSILDSVREIESKNGIKVTLSIGIGKDGQTFNESLKNARLAIDMALSRGGDQAIIRNKFNFEPFGGRSQELEKRTKVKSRVMATALAELIKDSTGVIVMGHKNADCDSLGAAVGITCIARKMGKRANIVMSTKSSADNMMEKLRTVKEYEDVFISAEDAIIEADSGTLIVVVDTNRRSGVEAEALLESANKIAVIDHHRRGSDYINDAVLNFHEPYASSTCELIAELMQYIVETRDVLNCEAEVILSGIVIDTKKFTMKTGVRTFEAAAYLRRAGADTTELKRILQDDIGTYVKRAEMVKLARMYHENIAIVEYNGQSTRSTAAQAADELLTIRGVQASFVLYREQDGINISARSLGEINVQVILEKLGGGGHFETAGAQVKNKKMEEVSKELMAAIDDVLG